MQRTILWLRLLLCRIFGHVMNRERDGQLIATACRRCPRLEALDQILYTARRKVTRGEIEQRMKDHPPEGYSFVSCNWKKRKARFVSASGADRFVTV
jgi:hypothetical protein